MMNEPGFIDSRATTIDETEVEKVDRKISGSPSHESIRSDYSQYTLKKRPWRLSTTNFAAIVAKQYRGNGTVEDPFIVTWLDEDFENPKAYTSPMRWSITMLIASMTLCVSLASSTYSGAFRSMIEEFHCSEEIIILGLSIMVLGYAIGPLLWGPICEVYGRRNIFIITYFIYTIFTACTCAAQNPQTLIVLRFFSGVFGSSSLVIPGGQIADLFSTETRGLGIGLFCAAPLLGPSLGPMIGGYIGDAAGWRWVIGFLALYASLLTLLGFLFLPETYSPTLLRQRAQRLSEVTGKVYLTILDAEKPLVWTHVVKQALFRPWVLLFREPIVLILTIYMSCIYGTLYMLFAGFPIVFQEGRGWDAGKGGLAFLGVGFGMLIGVALICNDNSRYVRIHRATGGYAPPECRLPPVIFGGGLIIIGIAWFAATNSPHVHWIVSILAGIPFATGLVLVFVCAANYLVDAYVVFAASVIAANGVMRSLSSGHGKEIKLTIVPVGAAFPLFTTYMFKNLGIHWASAVPGFIALACFPFPVLFYLYGKKLRLKCKYAAEAARILEEMKTGQRSVIAKH